MYIAEQAIWFGLLEKWEKSNIIPDEARLAALRTVVITITESFIYLEPLPHLFS